MELLPQQKTLINFNKVLNIYIYFECIYIIFSYVNQRSSWRRSRYNKINKKSWIIVSNSNNGVTIHEEYGMINLIYKNKEILLSNNNNINNILKEYHKLEENKSIKSGCLVVELYRSHIKGAFEKQFTRENNDNNNQ